MSQPPQIWVGDSATARLFLAYVRDLPDHPSKLRVIRAWARCFGGKLPLRNQVGARLVVDPLDVMGSIICFEGSFEPLSIALACDIMKSGGWFLDAGANVGIYTCTVGRIPNVRCISVDPSHEAFARLEDNIVRNRKYGRGQFAPRSAPPAVRRPLKTRPRTILAMSGSPKGGSMMPATNAHSSSRSITFSPNFQTPEFRC